MLPCRWTCLCVNDAVCMWSTVICNIHTLTQMHTHTHESMTCTFCNPLIPSLVCLGAPRRADKAQLPTEGGNSVRVWVLGHRHPQLVGTLVHQLLPVTPRCSRVEHILALPQAHKAVDVGAGDQALVAKGILQRRCLVVEAVARIAGLVAGGSLCGRSCVAQW